MARSAWQAAQPGLNPARLVFVDESGFSTKMARLYGRCRRGRRLIGRVPHGHWKTSTLVAGLRLGGVVAPCLIAHAMNGTTFRAWVEQMLAPTLAPGDIVVMDNLASHKVAGVRQAIEARGATLLYLPAYSPDLNPIEQLFAKLKAVVRKLAPRSLDALIDAIAQAIAKVTQTEPANYLANSGYPRLM